MHFFVQFLSTSLSLRVIRIEPLLSYGSEEFPNAYTTDWPPVSEGSQRVLDRAGHGIDKKTLEHLTKYCHFCQKHGKSPGRFRFTLRDDIEFNY